MESFIPALPVIFCDGASSGNPGPGGWGTILLIPDPQGKDAIIRELGGGDGGTTNNRMELLGAIQGLRHVPPSFAEARVYTDSTYVIRGITQWVWGWRAKGWKTAEGKDVLNQDLWRALMEQAAKRKIHWNYVRGHTGVAGNERCDEIAVGFSKNRRPSLYEGSIGRYEVDLLPLPPEQPLPESKKLEAKKAAHSYLSVVNGVPKRHSTWRDCEGRVKGVPGARFKKALSPQEEETILSSWGFKSSDLRS